MSKLIFEKDSDGQANSLYRIAENETVLNENKNFSDDQYDIIEVGSSDYDAVRNNTKYAVSHSGSNVTYEDKATDDISFTAQGDLDNYLKDMSSYFDNYLEGNSSKPIASSVTTYNNYIKSFDTSTLTYPMTNTWEQYCESQSVTYLNVLQLL